MRWAAGSVAVVGIAVTLLGTWKLWRINPDDKRYSLTVGIIAQIPTSGLVSYLADTKRALTFVLVGTGVQFVAVVLALLTN